MPDGTLDLDLEPDNVLEDMSAAVLDDLLPDRYPQNDLFICDIQDVVGKDIVPMMEHPFYSLSKKPDTLIRRYEYGDVYIEIVPSAKGIATIYDKDILVYIISQMIAALNQGKPIHKTVSVNIHEALLFMNRKTGGRDYAAVKDALARLSGTRIQTNIKMDGIEQANGFGLIDSWDITRSQKSGRILSCEVTLSNWLFRGIRSKFVLSLSPVYFRLKKPMERRFYEIGRKHCGNQSKWEISLEKLWKKSGSSANLAKFRFATKEICEAIQQSREKNGSSYFPDYDIYFVEGAADKASNEEKVDKVIFVNKGTVRTKRGKLADAVDKISLKSSTFDAARKLLKGWSVAHVETLWRSWMANSEQLPEKPDAAFIGFCKKFVKDNGVP